MSPLQIGDGRRLLAFTGREWLISDGRGGYALGTHAGLSTRKYHGLLVVSRPPPTGRVMALARVEDTLVADGMSVGLDTACYEPGVLHPEGFRHQVGFQARPYPTWTYEVLGRTIKKSIHLSRTGDGVRVTWELLAGEDAAVDVRPLITRRSHHAVARASEFAPIFNANAGGVLLWRPRAGESALEVRVDGTLHDDRSFWYRDVLYPVEQDRGYDAIEDLHAPCQFRLQLKLGEPVSLRARLDDEVRTGSAIPQPSRATTRHPATQEAHRALSVAADAFVISRPDGGPGIIAGYPWFEEWGRDTMIALPGILLATGRPGVAAELLDVWAERLNAGLLPNRLGDHHAVETNTADAPLLFIKAISALLTRSRAKGGVTARLSPAVHAILDAYLHGTRHGIGLDDDGLLAAGEAGLALTWMDAVDHGVPVTPRQGKPIELNALLLDGLDVGATLAELSGDDSLGAHYRTTSSKLMAAMHRRFLNPATGYIRDVVDLVGSGDGDAFRPNLLFALASSQSPFSIDEAERNLSRVEVELLVSSGLRTLTPTHPDYIGHYGGDQPSRDRAYHQGTVWPWLLGPYGDAVLKVRGDTPRTRQRILNALEASLKHVVDHGSLPEVYDGDDPTHAGGCPAQAWSVSEVQRLLIRVTS